MDPEEFIFMTDCLEEFKYPRIHSMDELEVANVFSKTNREFLVQWLLQEMDDNFCEIVEHGNKHDLGEIILDCGFCKKGEEESFMNGDISNERAFCILYTIFKYIKNIKISKKETEEGVFANTSVEEIDEYKKIDTNLFPMYGFKQTFSRAERAEKITEFCEEITNLKKLTNKSCNDYEETLSFEEDLKNQLSSNTQSLNINFSDFTCKLLEALKTKHFSPPQKINFHDDFANSLDICSTNITIVLQFIRSLILIIGFNENNGIGTNNNKNNNYLLHKFAELCNEVVSLKKKEIFFE